MPSNRQAKRRKNIQESLLEANVGCLLILIGFMGLPFVGLGLFFIYIGHVEMGEQARLNGNTVEVPAEILTSEIRRTTTRTGPGTGSTTTDYWPDIQFTYQYGGESLTSTKVWVVGKGGSEAEAKAVQRRYPQGAAVTAFVDPDNPGTAFLEKRWSEDPYVSVIIGVFPVAFVTGLGILLTGWRRPWFALVIATLMASVTLFLAGAAGQHYLRVVPEEDRHWAMVLTLAVVLPIALIPLAAIPKVRQLHRLYVEARREEASAQDADTSQTNQTGPSETLGSNTDLTP